MHLRQGRVGNSKYLRQHLRTMKTESEILFQTKGLHRHNWQNPKSVQLFTRASNCRQTGRPRWHSRRIDYCRKIYWRTARVRSRSHYASCGWSQYSSIFPALVRLHSSPRYGRAVWKNSRKLHCILWLSKEKWQNATNTLKAYPNWKPRVSK